MDTLTIYLKEILVYFREYVGGAGSQVHFPIPVLVQGICLSPGDIPGFKTRERGSRWGDVRDECSRCSVTVRLLFGNPQRYDDGKPVCDSIGMGDL